MQEPPRELHSSESRYAASTVEEIDPEPLPTRDFTRLREVVLGLLLLAGVLGWAGWQWWHSEWRRSSYEAGQAAANAKQWDEAHDRFTDAAGYHDAEARAAEAANFIKQRDLRYSEAAQEGSGKRWLAALQALEAVSVIEPGYSDTVKLLEQDRMAAETEALDSTIAMRTKANPPGLYLRKGDDWLWLEGSDTASVVHDRGAGGCVLYDVPSSSGNLRRGYKVAFLESTRFGYRSPGVQTVPAGQVTGVISYHCGEGGVWAFTLDDANFNQRFGVRQFIPAAGAAYYSYTAGQSINPFAGESNWPIMDIAPDGRHLLYAEVINSGSAGMSSSLYLADGLGGKRQVYAGQGGFFGAQISPDGTYILLITYTPPAAPGDAGHAQTQSVVLIDLLGRARPRVLTTGRGNITSEHDQSAVGATFMADGPYAGEALVARWDQHRSSYSIVDPRGPQDASIKISIFSDAQPDNRLFTVGTNNNKELLLMWQSGKSIQVARIDTAKPVATGALEIGPTEYLWDYRPVERGGSLIYATWQNNTRGLYSKDALALMSVSLAELVNRGASPKPIYSAAVGYAISGLPSVTPAYPGEGSLAYIDLKALQLHLKGYSTGVELPVEDGVTAIYPAYDYANQHRLLRGSDFGQYIKP